VPIKIAPSLASAPLTCLASVVKELETAGADYIHFDVEDGSFVPVMTLGVKVIGDLRPLTNIPFDVHLMMHDPEWLLPYLIEMGADRVAVHVETCKYPRRTLRMIAEMGAKAGVALNPATPLPDLKYLRPYLSFVLTLTTEPELSDCPFLPEILDKISKGKKDPALNGIEWAVDGGIGLDNIGEVVRSGADTVVVGRAIFKDSKIVENLRALREAANSCRS